jgi:hypothetical protein
VSYYSEETARATASTWRPKILRAWPPIDTVLSSLVYIDRNSIIRSKELTKRLAGMVAGWHVVNIGPRPAAFRTGRRDRRRGLAVANLVCYPPSA